MYRFHDAPKLLIDRANGSTRSWLAPQIAAAVATAIEQQAQCNLVQHRHQLGPSERNARRVRDVISLLEELIGAIEGHRNKSDQQGKNALQS